MATAPLRQRTALAVTATLAASARATAKTAAVSAAVSAVTATAALALTAPALATPAPTTLAAAPPALNAPARNAPALNVPPLGPAAPAAPGAPAPSASAPPALNAPAPDAPAPVVPAPDPPAPSCGTAADGGFPLATRIHGGPADYAAGGPLQAWKLDLTNTTDASCTGVHPVLVLADSDRGRALRPAQIRFEFYDAGSARWWPVVFETTEEAENVGVFADFGGFAVPAGRTLTVPVRLAFREDTAPDEVVVSAAVVQRRGADGDWVGASGDYRLTVGPVVPDASGTPEPTAEAAEPPGRTPAEPKVPKDADATAPRPELARTGRESGEDALVLAPFAAALVLLGAGLVRTAQRTVRRTARSAARGTARSAAGGAVPRTARAPHHPRHPRHP
ncbi:hypothetical protein OG357_24900 [Streptomyces sp. NBC_01255]|uniref:hypothetical protein n=1 Tax=Streptomyces sp. NBC_01255 TaxID=2903798 RepID=UPI002E359F7D|nr:hypothetical protein [Streptomyces sp. NBC_01255]